jgi:ribosomal protein S18 acetylase RimI-like enzyme
MIGINMSSCPSDQFPEIIYRVSPAVNNDELNALFSVSWPDHKASDFMPILNRSLAYICAYQGERIVGFVNLAWDGGIHAFLLDTTVHPALRRQGVGRELVQQAIVTAKERGIEWISVDFEPHLKDFYFGCGFRPTDAGVINLKRNEQSQSLFPSP